MKKLSILLLLSSFFLSIIQLPLTAGRKKSNKNKQIEKLQRKIKDQKKKHTTKARDFHQRHAAKLEKQQQRLIKKKEIMQKKNATRTFKKIIVNDNPNIYRMVLENQY